jgi:hypothetical protein
MRRPGVVVGVSIRQTWWLALIKDKAIRKPKIHKKIGMTFAKKRS